MGETAKDDRPWRAVPKASYAADNVEDLVEELEVRDEENADAMEEMSRRIEDLENAVGPKDGKGDIADRVDELETAAESTESEKEQLESQIYDLESSIARIKDRLARLERR